MKHSLIATNAFGCFFIAVFALSSCSKSSTPTVNMTASQVVLPTHKLAAFSIIRHSKYLVVLEAGLGDDHTVWNTQQFPSRISPQTDVLTYDRGGYGNSGFGPDPRTIAVLSSELAQVVNEFSDGRKVILIGHSLGGMIIRDYAVQHPALIAGLLFIDPSHEHYNQPTQADEDIVYNYFKDNYGANFGGTKESRELIENSAYTSTLPNLPNVPVVVITSMKTDADHSTADRQRWYDAHEMLRSGVTDFTHVTTTAGHYIMNEKPELVMEQFNLLFSKLPQ